MAMRLAALAEVLPHLPCQKEINGKKLLLTCENGDIVAKEVILDAAWQLKLEGLLKLRNDVSIFKVLKTELREELADEGMRGVVWLTDEVIPVAPAAAPEKKAASAGFGLGHHLKHVTPSHTHHLAVPEPWGGFEPVQPMLPSYAAGGIEHARIYGQSRDVPHISSQMKQCTLHEAFKIQPMDY
eukprot:jgi/Ulvmu1/322/UM001_0326.1